MTPEEERNERWQANFENLTLEHKELVAFTFLAVELIKLDAKSDLMALIDVTRTSFICEKLIAIFKVIDEGVELFPEISRGRLIEEILTASLNTLIRRDARQKKEFMPRLKALGIMNEDDEDILKPKHEPEVLKRKGEL